MWMRTYRNIFVWRVHTFGKWLFTTVSRKEFTSLELFLTVGPRQLNPPSILLCFNLIHERRPTEPFTAAVARAHRDIWLTALQTSRTLAADDVMDPFLFLVSIWLIVGPVPQWVYTCPGYKGCWDTKRTSAVTSQCSFLSFYRIRNNRHILLSRSSVFISLDIHSKYFLHKHTTYRYNHLSFLSHANHVPTYVSGYVIW